MKSLSSATATAPGNLEEVECGMLGLLHTSAGNLGILWEMGSFEKWVVLPMLCSCLGRGRCLHTLPCLFLCNY